MKHILVVIVLMVGLVSCAVKQEILIGGKPQRVERESVVINFAGDVRLDGYTKQKFDENGYEYPFERIKGILSMGDINCVNLETVVSLKGDPIKKKFRFRAEPEALNALTVSEIRMVSIANNHSGDYGDEAFLDTLYNLERAGIRHIGGGVNLNDARKPVVVDVKGRKIAFLAFANTLPREQWAGKEKPGIVPAFLEYIKRDVEAAAATADFVFVIYHGGDERSYYPKQVQKDIAYTAIDSGADVVIGHHPHVLQGMEIYKNRLIGYSLGNFLFLSPRKECYDTGVLQVIVGEGAPEYHFYPVIISDAFLRMPDDAERNRIYELLKKISEGMGSDLSLDGEKIVISIN